MPFRDIIPGKSKLSADYPAEKHVIRELFCVKAGFSTVKSAESQNFPRISFENVCHRRIILRQGSFSTANSTEVKTFRELSCGKFQSRKVKISLCKGLSVLLKLTLDNNSTMGDQYYRRFGRKIE
jgi:hypothetical protein